MAVTIERDWGLVVRTTVAGLLVAVASLAFVALMVWLAAMLVGYVVSVFELDPTGPVAIIVDALRDTSNWQSPLVVPLTALLLYVEYRWVARHPLLGAKAAEESTDEDLLARLRRLSSHADVPVPDLRIADVRTANSYAVGRRGNATVVVTAPLVERLDDDELDAVLAHELAHIRNRDVTVLTAMLAPYRLAGWCTRTLDRFLYGAGVVIIWGAAIGAGLLALGGILSILYHLLFGWLPGVAPLSSVDETEILFRGFVNGPLVHVNAYLLLLALFAPLPLAATGAYRLLLDPVPRLLTRYREFAADRGAVAITGNPTALASALETLDDDGRPTVDARRVDPVAALCLRSAGVGTVGSPGPLRKRLPDHLPRIDRLLSWLSGPLVAHPPTEERVRHLRSLVGRQ